MTQWISAHIFYNGNPLPLLLECVRPLVQELQTTGLIQRYFFIRYWESGTHIRLRLRPSEESGAEVRALLEDRVRSFLARRPSLFDPPTPFMEPLFAELYTAEYGEDQLIDKYGPDRKIPYLPNNSVQYIDYSPEYSRYGGPAGIELAERHFEVSSDMVLDCLESINAHVRTVLLGMSAQLMLLMCFSALDGPEEVREFLSIYINLWERQDALVQKKERAGYEERYRHVKDRLTSRVQDIIAPLQDGVAPRNAFERHWIAHSKFLRTEIIRLRRQNLVEFPAFVENDAKALMYLLSSYIHMTNNRLGVMIRDEVYLSYLLRRAIETHAGLEEVHAG